MVRQRPFLFLSFVGACGLLVSCSPQPLEASISDLSPKVRVGKKSIVKVRFSNPGRKPQALPTHTTWPGETRMDGVALSFIRSPDEKYQGGFLSLNVCPPQPPELLAAGESRTFDFAWTPEKEETGRGFVVFAFSVPQEIKDAKPVPVTVVP